MCNYISKKNKIKMKKHLIIIVNFKQQVYKKKITNTKIDRKTEQKNIIYSSLTFFLNYCY